MATAHWYWALDGERQGPLRTDELRQLLVTSRISPETLVWTRGMSEWSPASTIDDLAPAPPSPSAETEPPPPATPSERDLAPWSRRIAAKALDVLLIDLSAQICMYVLGWVGADFPTNGEAGYEQAVLVSFALVYWVYHVAGESGRHRATLGKQMTGIEVIGVDGLALGRGRIVLRTLAQIAIPFGFLLGPFHPWRQCAHDLMLGTLVVQRRPNPSGQSKPPS